MKVLVAGVGNVFFGDDGFGVEVIKQLGSVPAGTQVADIGIRAVHLAYTLLEPVDLLVVIDCMSRGSAPGTLYVLEPDTADPPPAPDAHGLDLRSVFAIVRGFGGTLPLTRIVGCEPETLEPALGLSESVRRAIPGAIDLVHQLITQEAPCADRSRA